MRGAWIAAGFLAAQPSALVAQAKPIYDVYSMGIRIAELTAGPIHSIRKFDSRANRWLKEHRAPVASVEQDTAFGVGGSLRSLPATLRRIQAINWRGLDLVGLPGAAAIYVRHRELSGTVAGRSITATYWAERDASRPLDFVIGADNTLIAGIDPSNDYVLVRRGYEAFTNVARWRGVSKPSSGAAQLPATACSGSVAISSR